MNELSVVNHNGVLVADSRDVAKMVNVRHADLLEKINGYNKILLNGKFRSVDFFIQENYSDSTGRSLPRYLLTKKGCEMVANKLTGEKGVLFTAAYVSRFNEMEQEQSRSAAKPMTSTQLLRLQVEAMEELERRQQEQERRIAQQEQTMRDVKEALQTYKPSDKDWQTDMHERIQNLGRRTQVLSKFIYGDIYRTLEREAHVKLKTRVTHKQERMRREGAGANQVRAVSRISIVADDPKLKIIFERVLQKMEVEAAIGTEG